MRPYKKVYLLTAIIMCMLIIFLLNGIEIDLMWLVWPSVTVESVQIACYENLINNSLPSLTSEIVPKNTSFFFVETSCHETYLKLDPRQSCAIESAALLNPSSKVYLLVPSPIREPSRYDSHTKILLTYENVKFRHVDMSRFFIGTPLEEWYAKGRLKSSKWPQSHASDILRYATLWKYGGTYLDLDVVLLKTFKGLTNFAGAESPKNVAAGFLSFTHGHTLSQITINDLRDKFKGYAWGNNGPLVITRALKKYCGVSQVSQMTKENCHGFTVYPPKAFYPIFWENWRDYFVTDLRKADNVMGQFNDSLAIHVWNKFSNKEKVIIGSGQPYDRLAATFCPKVYSTLGGIGNTF